MEPTAAIPPRDAEYRSESPAPSPDRTLRIRGRPRDTRMERQTVAELERTRSISPPVFYPRPYEVHGPDTDRRSRAVGSLTRYGEYYGREDRDLLTHHPQHHRPRSVSLTRRRPAPSPSPSPPPFPPPAEAPAPAGTSKSRPEKARHRKTRRRRRGCVTRYGTPPAGET